MRNNKTRVNIKARIDRHLRIVKDGKWFWNSILIDKGISNYHLYLVLFFIIFIFPFYPTLASVVYNNSSYDFYRWDIDESSILESYYWWDVEWEWAYNWPIFESTDSFISVNTVLNDNRNIEWSNEILSYEVKPWDSFSMLANNFNVTIDSILWANDFEETHTLRPGEVIKIPPVTWIIHNVESWDTLSELADKYDITIEEIREQNSISASESISVWDNLILPWAEKIIPKPTYVAPTNTAVATTPTNNTSNNNTSEPESSWYDFANEAQSQVSQTQWSFKLTRRQPQHTFYWGNCTRYVAQYKNVNWWGNANRWIANARAKWHATWSQARLWSIVQFSGTWYNPRYWHVWIVMEVNSDHIIVSDMNYRKLNEVTYRKVPINDRSIDWYIYVD